MIGSSVSACVEDLVKHHYPITVADVKTIFNDMAFDSPEEQVAFCRKYFWADCSDEAEKVFWELQNAGKIRQPKSLKYGKKILAKPFPKWYKTYEDFRARQMSSSKHKFFIELIEAEALHNNIV